MSKIPDKVSGGIHGAESQAEQADSDFGAPKIDLKEVRYSLPGILAELKLERRSSLFAMEILDQGEIEKIFAIKPK